MELSEFYRLIGMPPQAVQALEAVRRETDLTSPQLDGLRNSRTAQETYQQLKEDDDRDHLKLLLRYLEAARRTLDTYRERHIPLEVYAATMSCFSRFLAEDQAAFGRLCFPRGWWTWRQTSMRLFRIGALEYELRTREERPVIDLHIPSDADLSPVPKTISNGRQNLTLADIQWSNSTQEEGDGVVTRYTATVRYTSSTSSKYATGYTVTADYSGEVSKTGCNVLTYTAVFGSTDAPKDSGAQNGEPVDVSGIGRPLMIGGLVLALVLGGVFVFKKIRGRR